MNRREKVDSKYVPELITGIVERLTAAYRPQKVILFGSYARGDARADSDIDIFIIKDTKERMIDRCIEVRRLLSDPDRLIGLEIMVFTPDEVSQRLEVGDQFVREVLQEGKILYAS
ncbi:MAG: nucleotidyltransferase domain-containing protein [Candidatus Coatesbacteria bacterium]|nr:nucleotidyltransferase domain-containing protein [Candidatus Coatesbacteria bacterium]